MQAQILAQKRRRLRHYYLGETPQMKVITIARFFGVILALLPSYAAAQSELPCPSGSHPMPTIGTTFNILTGKARDWLCFDTTGNTILQSMSLTGLTTASNAGVFTNAHMNEYFQSILNGCNAFADSALPNKGT